jgi:SSS family solute:Na+ symporter
LVQLVVLLLGFAFAIAFALSGVGGWTGVTSAAPAISPDYLNFWHEGGGGGGSGWTLLALLVPNFIVSPGLLQKVYGARDARAIKLGLGLCGAALLLFAFAPAVLGMVARLHYPELADPDHALPLLLRANVPLIVGAVGLGALFVADLSSADAVLFMLSTSMSRDLYHRFIRPQASDRSILMVARVSAVAGGALAVGLAMVSESIIDALGLFYSLIAVSLFVPVIAGLYSRRGGAPEVFASVGAGIGVMLAVSIATDNAGFGIFTPNMSGLMAAVVGFGCVVVARALGRTAPEANTSSTK